MQSLAVPPDLVDHQPDLEPDPRGRPVGRDVTAAGHRAAGAADRLDDGSPVVSGLGRDWTNLVYGSNIAQLARMDLSRLAAVR